MGKIQKQTLAKSGSKFDRSSIYQKNQNPDPSLEKENYQLYTGGHPYRFKTRNANLKSGLNLREVLKINRCDLKIVQLHPLHPSNGDPGIFSI